MFCAAYFANMIATTNTLISYVNGTAYTSIVTVVTPVTWFSYFLGVWFIVSVISMFYVWTKKPIEKQEKTEW